MFFCQVKIYFIFSCVSAGSCEGQKTSYSPGSGVTGSYGLPNVLRTELSPLQEQYLLLMAEPLSPALRNRKVFVIVHFLCACVSLLQVCKSPWRPEEGVRCSGT